jgi:LAO/AO transport system kinase
VDAPLVSALSVSKGVVSYDSVNPHFRAGGRAKRPLPDVKKLQQGLLEGHRGSLSQAITLVESSRADHQDLARQLIDACMPYTGKSFRIGITGVPGVGKSTFIETFGLRMIENRGYKVAVLAVDPSSNRSGGSILGDKTRMEHLSNHPKAFVRPSPSSCSLGGVARKTRETILLCEAAGYDGILIETVGVGQSETTVRGMVDFFLLLMLAGAGDELQGIKRGIMEMADGLVITKADGENANAALRAKAEYQGALHLFPMGQSTWSPQVKTCSAIKNTGMDEVWAMLDTFKQTLCDNGYWQRQRGEQLKIWMKEALDQYIMDRFYQREGFLENYEVLEKKVSQGRCSPFEAANHLFKSFES